MRVVDKISNQVYDHVFCPGASQRSVQGMMAYLDKMPPQQAISPLQEYWQTGRRYPFAESGRFVTKALLLPCIPMHFLVGNRLASDENRLVQFYQDGGVIGSVHHWSIRMLRNYCDYSKRKFQISWDSIWILLAVFSQQLDPLHPSSNQEKFSILHILARLLDGLLFLVAVWGAVWGGIGLLLTCAALVSLGLLLALQAGFYAYQYHAAGLGKIIDDAIEKKFFPERIDCSDINQSALTAEDKQSI